MSEISETLVRHVAKLAYLSLTDKEVAKYSHDLSTILQYVDQLDKVDTASRQDQPHHDHLQNVFRNDEITNSDMRDQLLANAPMHEDGFLKVKSVF